MGSQRVGHYWVTKLNWPELNDPIAIYFIVLGSSLYTLSVFPVWRRSFSICWRAGLVVLNSLSFCLSVKLLISPSYLNDILAGYSNLDCRLFSFITLSMSCHSFLAWRVSIERSAVILMGIPLCVICCFSLSAFNISKQFSLPQGYSKCALRVWQAIFFTQSSGWTTDKPNWLPHISVCEHFLHHSI